MDTLPSESLTLKVIVFGPLFENMCEGFWTVELAPSPKSQYQLIIESTTEVELSVKYTTLP